MPWTGHQLAALRELGLPWAPLLPRVSADSAIAQPAQDGPGQPAEPHTRSPAAPDAAAAAPAAVAMPANSTTTRGSAPPVQTLDWTALRTAVADCGACGLCRTRTQTVFGVGSTSAHWMVVGEAPGEQEDLKGEPFVGAAGRLLDAMLAALGLSRAAPPGGDGARQAYIANTLKCRPPGNRNPQPSELASCEPFLLRQIELLRPRIIVASGRFAVQSLLRSTEPVGQLRGRVHRFHGVPLIVTYHPAYLLRNPMDKAKAWADLCLAAATYGSARGSAPHA